MNSKVARALRKASHFKPNVEREYKTFELSTGSKRTLQWDHVTGNVKEVIREGTSFITECVEGNRKIYKYMKRKYMNPDYVEILTPLPDQKLMDNIEQQARGELVQTQEVADEQ